ncbi:hypothetical protein ACO2Q9_09780 [Variovorax sp. VNK109]|uniref:hypothetical protein n=1 Tax=Variovorax sp. VNK109 TaxID=3400919 RepID=UPI003C05C0F0
MVTDSAPSHTELFAIASRLHKDGEHALSAEVPPSSALTSTDLPEGVSLKDGRVTFASTSVRNSFIANSIFSSISTPVLDTDALFEFAQKLWNSEIGEKDQASGRLLAMAMPEQDVVRLAAHHIRSGSPAFAVLQLVCSALPYIKDVAPHSFIDLLSARHEANDHDLASSAIYESIASWLMTRDRSLQLQLHDAAVQHGEDSVAPLICCSVMALAKADFNAAIALARTDAHAGRTSQSQQGIWTLGRLIHEGIEHGHPYDNAALELSKLIELPPNGGRTHAIRAAGLAFHVTSAFDDLLLRLAGAEDQDVLEVLAQSLFLHGKDLQARGIVARLLMHMPALAPESVGGLRSLDHSLARLLGDVDHRILAATTLTHWIGRHPITSERPVNDLFSDTARKLPTHPTVWGPLLTRWLLSEQSVYADAASRFLRVPDVEERQPPPLDIDQLDELDRDGIVFLARRLVGFVLDRSQLTSLALSLLRSRDAAERIFPIAHDLLVEQIGYDYPGRTIEAAREAANRENCPQAEAQFLRQVVQAIEAVVQAREALPDRNEFRPPAELRRLFSRARARQMDDSFERASRNSIWRQISSQVTIKAGATTFSFHDDGLDTKIELKSVSHSVELPARLATDPIGNDIRLHLFRGARRGQS